MTCFNQLQRTHFTKQNNTLERLEFNQSGFERWPEQDIIDEGGKLQFNQSGFERWPELERYSAELETEFNQSGFERWPEQASRPKRFR